MRYLVLLPAIALLSASTRAAARDAADDVTASRQTINEGADAPPSRWEGSILLLDQSVTTQTVGIGAPYQSYDPTYEWWVAIKPRYTVFDRGRSSLAISLWINAYLELTNSDTSTREHEILLGPSYLWASYAHTFREHHGYKSSVAIGPRFIAPTDKAAYGTGLLLGAGAIGGATQAFPLLGPRGRAFTGAKLGVAAAYSHYFDRATTAVDGGLHRLREDLNGISVSSDLLSGAMLAHDSLSVSVLGEVQILKRLNLSLSYVLIDYWLYPAPSYLDCVPRTGCVMPMTNADPTTDRVNTWVTATVTYDVDPELSVGAGYYNLANQLSPDGTRRSPLWSPAARFFLTVTGNLDAIYRRVRRRAPISAANPPPAASPVPNSGPANRPPVAP